MCFRTRKKTGKVRKVREEPDFRDLLSLGNFKCYWWVSSRDMIRSYGSGCCVWNGFEGGLGIPAGRDQSLHKHEL